jgi:DHA2 family multidrug resistance protein
VAEGDPGIAGAGASGPRARSVPSAAPMGFEDKPLVASRHTLVLICAVMMVSICQFLDATIANVALPHMKVSLGASDDTISWVLTSFIMAGAIFMPMTGWLSGRIGSRNLFIGSTVLFLVASACCGASTSLTQMVIFRAFQGTAAAFIGPMTQTILFDLTAPSKQTATMSYFGMVVMVAPISGPFLGGYLTDYLNWRWVYYINLPLGIPTLAILWWLLPDRPRDGRGFDVTGFALLAIGLGALQLVLDRGQSKDWFDSREIMIEAAIAGSMLWIYLLHAGDARHPLFSRELFTNPNFLVGLGFMTVLGLTNVALSSVLPTMYQTLYAYPVVFSGLMMAPRGFGVIITSQMVQMLLARGVDYRYVITIGYVIAAYSVWMMTGWSLEMDWHPIVLASFVQGLGLGMVFGPMNLVAFATIKPELRPDGSSLMALFRNMGGSLGISAIVTMLARNQQINHAELATHINQMTAGAGGMADAMGQGPDMATQMQAMDGQIARQASMISYLDNFKVLALLLLAIAPFPFLLKKSRAFENTSEHLVME